VTRAPAGMPPDRLPGFVLTGPDNGLAWGYRGNVVVIWEVPSGKLITRPQAHTRAVVSVAFSDDGKTVFSGDGGGVVAEWSLARPTRR
jgi:WD40 repeat protein